MRWDIKPLVGAGPLMLGMKTSEVANILDKASPIERKFTDSADGSSREHRGITSVVCHYRENILSGIDINSNVSNVYFEDIDIFATDARIMMTMLSKRNGGGAKFGFGFVLFEKIAISAKGFYFGNKNFYPSDKNDRQDERGLGIYDHKEFVGPVLEAFKIVRF